MSKKNGERKEKAGRRSSKESESGSATAVIGQVNLRRTLRNIKKDKKKGSRSCLRIKRRPTETICLSHKRIQWLRDTG